MGGDAFYSPWLLWASGTATYPSLPSEINLAPLPGPAVLMRPSGMSSSLWGDSSGSGWGVAGWAFVALPFQPLPLSYRWVMGEKLIRD